MASSWGSSWGTSWANSWGTIAGAVTVSGGFKGEKKRRKKREEERPVILRRGEQRYGPDNDYGLDSLDRPEPIKVEKKKKKPRILTSFAELSSPETDLTQFTQTSSQLQGLMAEMSAAELLKAQQMQLLQEQEDEEMLMLMMLVA